DGPLSVRDSARESCEMSGPETLTRKQLAAVVALMESPTIEAAAQAVAVAVSTLYRWLKLPAFQAAYREARAEAVDDALARLQKGARKAADTLIRNCTCQKPTAEIAAAIAVLDRLVRLNDHADLEARIAALEELARQRRRAG